MREGDDMKESTAREGEGSWESKPGNLMKQKSGTIQHTSTGLTDISDII